MTCLKTKETVGSRIEVFNQLLLIDSLLIWWIHGQITISNQSNGISNNQL